MAWLDEILDPLTREDHWGYRVGELRAAEPLTLAALALIGHDRSAGAAKLLEALCELQDRSGAVGIYQGTADPHWSTAHAVIAWSVAVRSKAFAAELQERFQAAAVSGCEFILSVQGTTIPPEVAKGDISHDTMLVGWPWVEGTHSWLEPTAMCYLALRATEMQAHSRAIEAVRLMLDRMLPAGGCNYGNTFVLGQLLRPHLQPTGIVLLALAGTEIPAKEDRVAKSIAWVDGTIGNDPKTATTTTSSLAYGLLGLAAHGRARSEVQAAELLNAALKKPSSSLGAYLPRRSLAALAALGNRSPLVTLGQPGAAP